jgi:hypothetical protein
LVVSMPWTWSPAMTLGTYWVIRSGE